MERVSTEKESEFVFIGNDTRPHYVKDGWLWWWHPDKKWVSEKKLTDQEIKLLPDNLSKREQSLYFKDSEYKPSWYEEKKSDFCRCGQIKHVGCDECWDCLDVYGSHARQ